MCFISDISDTSLVFLTQLHNLSGHQGHGRVGQWHEFGIAKSMWTPDIPDLVLLKQPLFF